VHARFFSRTRGATLKVAVVPLGSALCLQSAIAMWRSKMAVAWDWMASRKAVGRDVAGNFYYVSTTKGVPTRRFVEFKDGVPSTETMPIEWWAWLHRRRDLPPTEEELARATRQSEALAERVAILNAEDEKDRLRSLASTREATKTTTPAERKRASLMQLASSPDVALSDRPRPQQQQQHLSSEQRDRFEPEEWRPSS
jgi:NADH:ubiquinone oxidoreductase subunit